MPSLRLLVPILALASMTWLAPGAASARVARPSAWASGQPVTVAIVGDHGDSLPTVAHHGTTFVAGELGHRYEIVLTNQTADRLEVVVSVDGRDTLSGQKADFRRHRGYVIEPFGTVRVDGFRRSLDHVAAFRFADLEDSFSARKGTPQNVGAIGVAVFRERTVQAIARSHGNRAKTDDARAPSRPSTTAPKKPATDPRARPADKDAGASRREHLDERLGTEFGEDRVSRVRLVSFTRRDASRPDARIALQYDSVDALVARGIPIGHVAVRPVAIDPEPWPGAQDDGFTQPPPPRRR